MADDTRDIISTVQSGYDQIAEKYLAWTEHRPSPRLRYTDKLLVQCVSSTNDKLKLLELGCGAGVPVTRYLASQSQVAQVVANDLSSRQLELARERVPKDGADVTFISGDMSSLDFGPETFHGVAAFFSLIHLPFALQRTTLFRIQKWLKPGGRLVCNFATAAGSFSNFLGAPMYWEDADVKGSLAMVRDAGLHILEHEIFDATDGQEILDADDPDAAAMFLWVVATKPPDVPAVEE